MEPTTIELMEEHVRDIYRAATGAELPEQAQSQDDVSLDEVASRFIDLESQARRIPTVAERVPPFSFSPPLDLIADGDQFVLELAVPGVVREDVDVQFSGEIVSIRGSRGGERGEHGRYLHAEIPRGPFHRIVHLPFAADANATVEVVNGLIRVCLPNQDYQAKSSAIDNPQQPATADETEANNGKPTKPKQ